MLKKKKKKKKKTTLSCVFEVFTNKNPKRKAKSRTKTLDLLLGTLGM